VLNLLHETGDEHTGDLIAGVLHFDVLFLGTLFACKRFGDIYGGIPSRLCLANVRARIFDRLFGCHRFGFPTAAMAPINILPFRDLTETKSHSALSFREVARLFSATGGHRPLTKLCNWSNDCGNGLQVRGTKVTERVITQLRAVPPLGCVRITEPLTKNPITLKMPAGKILNVIGLGWIRVCGVCIE
jgi:hypothetical protein